MMKWKHQKTDFSGDSDVESSLAVLDRVLSEFDDIETDSVFEGDSETPSSSSTAGMEEEESRTSRRSSLAEVPLATKPLNRAPAPTASTSSAAPPPVDRSTKPRPGSAGGTPVASWRSTKSGVDHSTVRSSASQPARAETEAKPGAEGVKRASSRVNGLVRSFETTIDCREAAPQQPATAAAVVSRAASSCVQKPRTTAETRPRRAQSETRFGDSVGARAAAASASRLVRQIGPPPSTRPPPPPPPPSSQSILSSAAPERSPPVRSPGETDAALASRTRRLSSTADPAAASIGELPPLPTKAMLRQKSSPHINYLPPSDPRRRSLPAKDLHTGESSSLFDQTHIESKIKRLSLNFEPSGPIRFPSRLSREGRVEVPHQSQRTAVVRQKDARITSPTEGRGIYSPGSAARFDETASHGDAELASDSTTNDLRNSSLRTRIKKTVTSSVSVPLMQPDLESLTITNGEITASKTPPSLKKTDTSEQTFISTNMTHGMAGSGSHGGEVGEVTVTSVLEEEQRPSLPAKQHSARSRDERRPPARRKRDRKRELSDNPPPPEEARKQISLLLNRSQLVETPTSTLNGSVSTLGSSASTHGAGTAGRPHQLRPAYLESRLRPSRPAPSPPIQRQASAPALPTSGSLRSRHSDTSASAGHRASQSFRATPPGDSLQRSDVTDRQADPARSGSNERAAEAAESRAEMGEAMFDVEDSGEMSFSYVYNHSNTGGAVDAAGPMSLPPSLGIDDSVVQPSNSFPKKMPLFSPIVKDRLNDNTNMYIPAPPSPRPDYCDSELSETDSLTRDGSDNESLFALKDKKADRKETGPRFVVTKISPPMHRKNKVKESKERHNKSKQKDKTPEKEGNEADTKKDNKGKKDKKQASPPRAVPLTSASSVKTQAQASRKISSQSRAPSGKTGDQKALHPPKQVSSAKLLLSQKPASPLKKQSSSSKLSKQQAAAPLSPQRSTRAEAGVSPKQRLSSTSMACSPTSSAAEAAASASASSPTPATIGVLPPSSKEPTSSASKRKSPPKQTLKSNQQTPLAKQQQATKTAPSPEQVKSPEPPASPQRAAASPSTSPRLSTAAAVQEPEPGTSCSPAQSEASPSQPGDGASVDAAAPPAKTPLQVMIEDFHKNLPPPPTFDDALNVSMDGPVSLAEEVEMEPDDSYYSDDSLDFNQTGESKKRSTRRRRRKSDWSTTTSFDYVHRKEARKKIPEKLTHRDEGISSLESHNSASDDNDVTRKGNRASGKHLSALEAVGDLAKLEDKLGMPGVSADNGKSKNKFDSIRKLLKEGRLEGLGTPPPDFVPPPPPVVRVKAGRRVEELTPTTGKEVESSSARMRLRNGDRPARPRSHSQPTSSLLEGAAGRQRGSESPADVRISRSFLHQSSKSSLFVDYRRPGGGSPSSAGGKGASDGAEAPVSSAARRRPAPRPDPALRLRPERSQQRSESPLRRNRPVRPPEGVQVNPLTHARPGVPPSPLAAGFHSAESLHCSLPPVLRASGGKGPNSRGHLTLPGERMSEKRDIRRADSLTVHKKEKEGDSKFKFSIFKGFWRRKQYSLEQV